MSIKKLLCPSFNRFYSTLSSNKNKAVLKRKDPIIITPSAENRLAFIITQSQNSVTVKGVRIGIKSKGCSGLSYTIDYIHDTLEELKKVKNDDVVLCNNNVKVFIDPKSIMTIIGTTMDYIETDISSEFTFINPKSKGSCGCGESFII